MPGQSQGNVINAGGGFDGYSQAMKASGIVWNERTLDKLLRDPTPAVPGTAMTYAGVNDARGRVDLIAWLRVATRPGAACTIQRCPLRRAPRACAGQPWGNHHRRRRRRRTTSPTASAPKRATP